MRLSFLRLAPRFAVLLLFVAAAPTPAAPRVNVILWFDTEDYILPASDDAALRVADFLTREGIRGTFKIVGEKARVLEQRGRKDVIDALKKHEIGYHTNYHSWQPSPAMYLSNLGWDEGVAEFDRRERAGVDDVQRIFGVAPSCYGQPGSSWAPQVFGAMRRWGMPVYLDAGRHVSLDGRPHYFGGALTLYHLTHLRRASLGGDKDLETACEQFAQSRRQLLAEGGGMVSVIYHPCEFVHKEFWDGVNFRDGANPPREAWKLPPTKTEAESATAYRVFEGYVRFMKRFPEVRFITALDALRLYPDRAKGRSFPVAELRRVAEAVGEGVTFQRHGDVTLAASEVLALLADYVTARASGKPVEAVTLKETPFGPPGAGPGLPEPITTDRSQFLRTTTEVADMVRRHGRVPTAVWLGSRQVPPEAYLRALATVARDLLDGKEVSERVEVKPAQLAAAAHVAEDASNLWGWVIFPRGFRAPTMMQLAKRQAWTLKPAVAVAEE